MSARRFWRLWFTNSRANTYVGAREVILATTAGGAQAATGGTASAGSVFSVNWPAAGAFDGDLSGATGTEWYSANNTFAWTGDRPGSDYLQYEMPVGSPIDVAEVRIVAPGTSTASPARFLVYSSDDGVVWQLRSIHDVDPPLTTAGDERAFSIPPTPPTIVGREIKQFFTERQNTNIGPPPSVLRIHANAAGVGDRNGTRPTRFTPFSGGYYIAGSTTSLGLPAPRRVDLIDQRSGALVDSVRTGPDGQFLFDLITEGPWTVLGVDDTAEQNSVVFAHVVAAPMI